MPVDERTFVADVATWVTAILDRRPDLPYSRARVEEHGAGSRKRHDFLLYRRGIERVVLTGEVKMPDASQGRSPFDAGLIGDAHEKASRRGVPYYFTWNVRDFVLFQTHRDDVPFMDRQVEGPTQVADVQVSDDVRRPEVEGEIKTFWEEFLERYAALEEGRRSLQNLPLDRRFILRLEHALEDPISLTWDELTLCYRRDAEFRSSLRDWMVRQQGWEVSESPQLLRSALERAARLSCYVLVTRLVFYEVLRRIFRVLPALAGIAPESPQELADILRVRFADAITHSHDYETIFEADDLGVTLPFIAAKAHHAWTALIERIEEFDFSRLDFEVIGRMYEQLIGPAERRRYGQFYTSPEVVDLINAFCIRSPDARALDPGCGGGTFLVRAYTRKRALATRQGQVPTHQQLLGELFGVDIAAFAAQLATINLAVRHLSDEPNYPRVARSNFFDVQSGIPVYRIPRGAGGQQEIPLAELDAVVGNPPYIRQEEIAKQEKGRLAKLFGSEWPGQGALSGRSDIYLHFFTHAAALLKPGGYLGFITSIGWLDTEYGFHLQEWMLRNFRIVAIIESQVEKWFEDARVTTAVTILQREPDEAARRQNRVRFIYLRKPLAEIYTEALHGPISEENEVARQADMDAIRDLFEEIHSNQNTDYWRVRVLTQNELWNEGCRLSLGDDDSPSEAAEYKGGKWGQHIRGPDAWFDIRDRVGSRLVPLQELAEIRRGFTSGIDRFFCVRDVTEAELRGLPNPAAFRAKWGIGPDETKDVRIVLN